MQHNQASGASRTVVDTKRAQQTDEQAQGHHRDHEQQEHGRRPHGSATQIRANFEKLRHVTEQLFRREQEARKECERTDRARPTRGHRGR